MILVSSMSVFAKDKIIEINDKYSFENKYEEKMLIGSLQEIGHISIKEQLKLNDKCYDLYATFDNPEDALINVSKYSSDVITSIQNRYLLKDFSTITWKKYYEKMFSLLDDHKCPEWYTESNDQFIMLRDFFDIYENTECNAVIHTIVSEKGAILSNDLILIGMFLLGNMGVLEGRDHNGSK